MTVRTANQSSHRDLDLVKMVAMSSTAREEYVKGNNASRKRSAPMILALGTGLLALLMVLYLFSIAEPQRPASPSSSPKGKLSDAKAKDFEIEADKVKQNTSSGGSVDLEEGSIESVPFYRCRQEGAGTHLFLLHGAAFTKEDWKRGDLLDRFCSIPGLSTIALDLSVSSTYKELVPILDTVRSPSNKIAVLTPSASGKAIKTWLENDPNQLKEYIQYWIPVAPGSFTTVAEDQLSLLKDLPILAIYGSHDIGGKVVSYRLRDMSQAQVQEVPGGHPCYLESPELFVQHVRKFLEL